ncbi:MAG: hypothetical protein KatS3mg105_0951 [Gemmatales bacterium]|nr:MAG: hypothetical protein KatS3mg105_0951 [Gemmatales bacterium]
MARSIIFTAVFGIVLASDSARPAETVPAIEIAKTAAKAYLERDVAKLSQLADDSVLIGSRFYGGEELGEFLLAFTSDAWLKGLRLDVTDKVYDVKKFKEIYGVHPGLEKFKPENVQVVIIEWNRKLESIKSAKVRGRVALLVRKDKKMPKVVGIFGIGDAKAKKR